MVSNLVDLHAMMTMKMIMMMTMMKPTALREASSVSLTAQTFRIVEGAACFQGMTISTY